MSLCTQHIYIWAFCISNFPVFTMYTLLRKHIIHNLAPIRIFSMHKYVTSLIRYQPIHPQTPIFAYIYYYFLCIACMSEFLYTHWKFARRTLKAYLSFGICVHVFHVLLLSFSFFLYIRTLKTDNVANDERGIYIFFLLMNKNKAMCVLYLRYRDTLQQKKWKNKK